MCNWEPVFPHKQGSAVCLELRFTGRKSWQFQFWLSWIYFWEQYGNSLIGIPLIPILFYFFLIEKPLLERVKSIPVQSKALLPSSFFSKQQQGNLNEDRVAEEYFFHIKLYDYHSPSSSLIRKIFLGAWSLTRDGTDKASNMTVNFYYFTCSKFNLKPRTILRFFKIPLYLGVFLNSLKCKTLDRLCGEDESLLNHIHHVLHLLCNLKQWMWGWLWQSRVLLHISITSLIM